MDVRSAWQRTMAAIFSIAMAALPALAWAQGGGTGSGGTGSGGTGAGGGAGGATGGGGGGGGSGLGWILIVLAIAAVIFLVTRRRRVGHRP